MVFGNQFPYLFGISYHGPKVNSGTLLSVCVCPMYQYLIYHRHIFESLQLNNVANV